MATVADLEFDVAMAPALPRLKVDSIRRDGGTQMRVDLNSEAVNAYAERLDAGDVFPPIVVFYDGAAHWLADGFHRVGAMCLLASRTVGTVAHQRWTNILSDVRSGTRLDAVRYAIAANRTNGLRRTNADKQIAVRSALAHPDMQSMSDQAIADEAGVTKQMVQQHRKVTSVVTSAQPSDSKLEFAAISPTRARTGVDGKRYPAKQLAGPKVGRPASKTPEERREAERIRIAAKRAEAKGMAVPHKMCPMCNGKGYLND